MSGPYTADDDRLAQAFREVFKMKVEFDMAEEVRKATEWARQADERCPTCGRLGFRSTCPTCERS